jgi:hypothetical protein
MLALCSSLAGWSLCQQAQDSSISECKWDLCQACAARGAENQQSQGRLAAPRPPSKTLNANSILGAFTGYCLCWSFSLRPALSCVKLMDV